MSNRSINIRGSANSEARFLNPVGRYINLCMAFPPISNNINRRKCVGRGAESKEAKIRLIRGSGMAEKLLLLRLWQNARLKEELDLFPHQWKKRRQPTSYWLFHSQIRRANCNLKFLDNSSNRGWECRGKSENEALHKANKGCSRSNVKNKYFFFTNSQFILLSNCTE